MKNRDQLIAEITDLIVDSLNLHFIKKDEVTAETVLLGEGLGLDSVDILEVVVAIEQQYGVKIVSAEQGREVFGSIGSSADFVALKTSGDVAVNQAAEQQM